MRLPFPGEVHNAPAAFALLNVFDLEARQFLPTEATTRQRCC
jgi:hypothetical protein